MFHRIMAGIHGLLAAACFGWLFFANPHGSESVLFGTGMVLFAGMAVAVWQRSRWAWLPGMLIIIVFTFFALIASMAFIWPESTVNRSIAFALAMIALEIASLVAARPGCPTFAERAARS